MSTSACSFSFATDNSTVFASPRSGCIIDNPSGTFPFLLTNVTHTASTSGSRTNFSHASFASSIASSLTSLTSTLLSYLPVPHFLDPAVDR